ncbi:MAG: methylmalonyl Co-A mutase-associated GTPase MeaB [Chloroflexota bacterium]
MPSDLYDRAIADDRRALARVISMVEDHAPGSEDLLARMHLNGRRAHIVGITGPPGTGKSTLVAQLIREFRQRGRTVGVVAVDPTSPFSGGAVLGDRVRMQDFVADRGVFIRSMATRGHLGGVAATTADVVRVMEASGREIVIVETVGAGQAEVDIVRTADTTVVVEVPGLGDDVQAIKAGMMEIADIFAVNKADLDNVERVVLSLRLALHLGPPSDWKVPVLRTIAIDGRGIAELVDAIEKHRAFLGEDGRLRLRERERVRFQIMEIVEQRLRRQLLDTVGAEGLDLLAERVAKREQDPYAAADELLDKLWIGK